MQGPRQDTKLMGSKMFRSRKDFYGWQGWAFEKPIFKKVQQAV